MAQSKIPSDASSWVYYDQHYVPSPVTIPGRTGAQVNTGITGFAYNAIVLPRYLCGGILTNWFPNTSGNWELVLEVFNPNDYALTVDRVWLYVHNRDF